MKYIVPSDYSYSDYFFFTLLFIGFLINQHDYNEWFCTGRAEQLIHWSIILKANALLHITNCTRPLSPILAKMSKEPAKRDKISIGLNAGRWELEVTAATAVQVGRTSTATAFLCPQNIWTFVIYVSGLQAADRVCKTGSSWMLSRIGQNRK